VEQAMPPEVQKIGRMIKYWFDKMRQLPSGLQRTYRSPGQPDIKRIGFGFRNLENYRIRALL
jgi:hypothetical protein